MTSTTVTIQAEEYSKILKANHNMLKVLAEVKALISGIDCRYYAGEVAILKAKKLIDEVQNETEI